MDGQFEVADELIRDACKYCAPLFIIETKYPMGPRVTDSNATITFIQFRGRTYGITCKHVVEIVRERNKTSGNEFSHTLYIALEKHHIVQDRFSFPTPDWLCRPPDIAIRELHPELPKYLGKQAFDIEASREYELAEARFAIAVGFPDNLTEETGETLAMPCVHSTAENRSKAGDSFSLYSELDAAPSIHDLSGMSGGPIYWSSEEDYGLLGIVYEAAPLDGGLGGEKSIHIKGQRINLSTIERWIEDLEPLWNTKESV